MTDHRAEDVDSASGIHSFIIRIWVEEMETEARRTEWHGHVTYVQNGERRYIKRLGDIAEFILAYLPSLSEE